MRSDYHVHSEFSDDSVYPIEDVIRDAIEKGLDEIVFTDHVDYGIKTDADKAIYQKAGRPDLDTWIERDGIGILYNVDYPAYFKKIEELRKKYEGKIRIKSGLELGIQKETLPLFEALMDKYKDQLDFVLLSVHQLENKEFWTGDYQKVHNQFQFYKEYYEELLWLVKHFKQYSVLAHLDLINRYDTYGKEFQDPEIDALIDEILKTVIADGKGIEVNTSSIRYEVGDTTPSRSILERYRNMGGKIITIGSDSHRPDHLGTYIDEHQSLLRELGFENHYTYEKMKEQAHKL